MKLLLIENDSAIFSKIQNTFATLNFEIFQATSSQSGLALAQEQQPNVVIISASLKGKSGFDTLKEIKRINSGIAVIMVAEHNSTKDVIKSMRFGAFDYITMPFDTVKCTKVLLSALEANLLSRKVRVTLKHKELPGSAVTDEDIMIGSSPEMVEIWKMVGKVADSDETILISGESGTGKELLARAIYNNSNRSDKPFLAINCAALPDNLLESELFGHEKGAFTDAHTLKIGKFEQCHGGTLFLDEISELSLISQSKLLRVLEDRSFMRLGGNKEIRVDVRIIAATNRSMINEVKAERFRLDLFYRLRIISFFLPPLRERKSDIPLLIDLFVKQQAQKANKKIFGLSPDVLEFLMTYNWQGNIRELKNAISSAVVFSQSEILKLGDFSHLVVQNDNQGSRNDYLARMKELVKHHFPEVCSTKAGHVSQFFKEDIEPYLVALAMESCQNNQVAAAKLLGISRNTLRKHLGC